MTLDELTTALAGGPDRRVAAMDATRALPLERFMALAPTLLAVISQEQPARVNAREALLNDDEQVGAAVKTLLLHGLIQPTTDALVRALQSPSTRVRAAALRGLALVGDRNAAVAALTAMRDVDGHVAGVASHVVLGLRLKKPPVVQVEDAALLMDAIEHSPNAAAAAANALGHMEQQAAAMLPRLMTWIRTEQRAHLKGPALVAAAQLAPGDVAVDALANDWAAGSDKSLAGYGRTALRLMKR